MTPTSTERTLSSDFFRLPRWQKRVIMVVSDAVMLAVAVWLGFAIRLGELMPAMGPGVWVCVIAPLVSIPIFARIGMYRAVIRYIGSQALLSVAKGAFYSTLAIAVIVLISGLKGVPRSLFFIYFGLTFLLTGGSRFLVRYWYYHVFHRSGNRVPVAIYGAGQSGIQLANALGRGRDYLPVLFVDDNRAYHGTMIQGLPVVGSDQMAHLIERHGVRQVLLAMPSVSKERRREILQQLEVFPVHVRSIPSAADLVSGRSDIEDLHEIQIDELLGRTPVPPDMEMIQQGIAGKNVMVTGAGGSIGSELCRQILQQRPSVLVLFEISEHALYQIERELRDLVGAISPATHIAAVLGSVQDGDRIEETLRTYRIHQMYHAAAYKHVPLVEHNPFEGIRNNSLGTLIAAQAAQRVGIERFVLISTDKAVRPTNVMGASKRLAEMALQSLARQGVTPVFAMVRFGNVLGSSGSVVPLFREQIQAGGPVTVTHPEVIRYFMSIPEAAQLVLQAAAMAQGGEIFILDMGEPVKIVDLAKRMIRLSGNWVQGENGDQGGIALEFTGLRPGEKLYEELLISGASKTTAHPQILQADDVGPEWSAFKIAIEKLTHCCQTRDAAGLGHLLNQWVEGCQLAQPLAPRLVDHNPATSTIVAH